MFEPRAELPLPQANSRQAFVHVMRARPLALATIGLFLVLVSLVRSDRPAFAYAADPTHRMLATHAINLLLADARYREIPLYLDTIVKADIAEDGGIRMLNHFYDPTTGLGLPQNGYTKLFARLKDLKFKKGVPGPGLRYLDALSWARDGMPDHLDWKSAIEAYDYSDAARIRAYEALGHVLHVVQDMGQPDHARDRPHPGNYVPLPNRVGYETLWAAQSSWPLGQQIERQLSLKAFFDDLATESQQAESAASVPFSDENALGVGPFRYFLSSQAYVRKQAQKFNDHLWAQFELHVPLIPKIPWPNNQDQRTQTYLALGNKLLPRTEEYGAGLLEFYYDIVNPPPYVESVQLSQNGTVTYKATWNGQMDGERLAARQLETQVDTTLDADMDTEVRIQFGSALTLAGQARRKTVQSIAVWVVPGNGAAAGAKHCSDIPVAKLIGNGEYAHDLWVGTFTPVKDGTLCIEASDTDNHFVKDDQGQARNAPGDALDSNPATVAKAGSAAPYDWTGYEPGPDLNHHFKVESLTAACAQTPLTPEQIDKMRWGTWTGSWSRALDGKDIDVRVGGHGRSQSTYSTKTSANVSVRSTLGYNPLEPNLRRDTLGMGHTTGSIVASGFVDTTYADGFKEHQTTGGSDMASAIGFVNLRSGYYSLGGGPTSRGSSIAVFSTQGTLCPDLTIRGSNERQQGDPNGEIYSHLIEKWNFSFSPADPPPHFTAIPTLLCFEQVFGDGIHGCGSRYADKVNRLVNPIVDQLRSQQKFQEAFKLQQILQDAYFKAISPNEDKEAGVNYAINQTYTDCDGLWISNDPDADTKYAARLADLKAALAQRDQLLQTVAEQYATVTEQVAAAVAPVDRNTTEQLLQLAQNVRSKGLAHFDSTAP